jgi:DNA polymerase zeta
MNKPSLRVRISNIDHTIASSGLLDSTSLRRVPVIRVYGDTSLGQKACVHIHQVYPYFFVEYKGEMNPHDGTYYHLVGIHKP